MTELTLELTLVGYVEQLKDLSYAVFVFELRSVAITLKHLSSNRCDFTNLQSRYVRQSQQHEIEGKLSLTS